jgi:ribonuclease III
VNTLHPTLQKYMQSPHMHRALTHSSHPAAKIQGSYERLEFLGDALLDFCLADMLFQLSPELNEGQMSKYRASLVCEATLATKARELYLDRQIRVGSSIIQISDAVIADVMEAVLAAIYLDFGMDELRTFIDQVFMNPSAGVIDQIDAKTTLQELMQLHQGQTPVYEAIEKEGPDHAPRFKVQVRCGASVLATAEGASIKDAGQRAARLALNDFKQTSEVDSCSA